MPHQIIILGDFPSRKDEDAGGAWRDGLAKMFKSFMRQAGLNPREALFLNVIDTPQGSMDKVLCRKSDGIPNMKPVKKGASGYMKAEFKPQVERLWKIINNEQPNLILACGDIATWATATGHNSIEAARGRIAIGNSAINACKVLPTYSPKQVVANWPMRPVLLADLDKASREMQFKEIRRPQRFIHVEPTLEDMEDFLQTFIMPSQFLASDIETKAHMITCVSFAPTTDRALVVPFYCAAHTHGNYWATQHEEYLAWKFVKRVLSLGKAVSGQNYQYDMQYEWREMGIPNSDFADDTMLLHHVLQPELRKGLGFLASIYTDEIAWKGMHKVSASDKAIKRGDQE